MGMGPDEFMRRILLLPHPGAALTQNGKKIHNTNQVKSKLKGFATGIHKAAKVDCSLCFSSCWRSSLHPACGRKGCNQRICSDCASSWYGINKSGSIINTAALACPFCRRFPAPRTLAKYGKGVHAVQNLKDATTNHESWIYAWCAGCSSVREFAARDCARGLLPEVTNWQCEVCVEDEQTRKGAATRIKPCPGCGIMSERSSGCGHIACPVEGCGTHWCYFCGKDVGEGRIYKHMAEKHGAEYGYEGDYDWGNNL
ncbi:hypothetical protein BDV06DRAFT_227037 [Aspergillus oleicola]